MSNLKAQLIRLGEQRPELRDHIRPVLDKISTTNRTATSGFIRAFSHVAKKKATENWERHKSVLEGSPEENATVIYLDEDGIDSGGIKYVEDKDRLRQSGLCGVVINMGTGEIYDTYSNV